jgi:hypothetical protein
MTTADAAAPVQLFIRGACVVDPRDGSLRQGQDVLIADDRIVAVRPSGAGDLPGTARVIDGAGKFLVPGFCDMHAHMHSSPVGGGASGGTFDLMLAYGITGFRQMSGSPQMLKDRAAGTLMPPGAPRLLAMPGTVLTPLNAGTTEMAAATIREQHDLGADFIKAAFLPAAVFHQAQSEAARVGIPILGHLTGGVDAIRASGEGMRSIEHLGPGVGLLACCSTERDAVEAEVAARPLPKMPPVKLPFLESIFGRMLRNLVVNPLNRSQQGDVDILDHVAATFDGDAVAGLTERFVADGTWQVPTLIRAKTTHLCDDPAFREDPNLRYLSPAALATWTKAADKFASFPSASRQTFRTNYAILRQLTRLLDEAGARMLAGSDSGGAAWEVPGAALHQEFDELSRAGLAPLRILQMTTSNAAEFLAATDMMGSVDAGKYADLVLLDANPVESADALHGIAGVVRAGRYYSAADLDLLKEKVASARSVR